MRRPLRLRPTLAESNTEGESLSRSSDAEYTGRSSRVMRALAQPSLGLATDVQETTRRVVVIRETDLPSSPRGKPDASRPDDRDVFLGRTMTF
jgi:hypothetical protein